MSTEISTLLVSSPDVCGGLMRIDGTRITVYQIATLHKQGFNADDIADQYPDLTLAQVYAALAHYHANREEIEAGLTAENEESDKLASGSSEPERRLQAFKALQRSLNLTPAKVAEWQDAIRDARR
jgi:uncharacterized protein (DUF433 family)